jgi:transposase-like protein
MSPPFEGFYLKLSGAKVYEKTMRTYPEELKAKIIARLLPPNNEYIPDVAKETGIPKDTLYAWRIKHRQANQRVESGQASKMTSIQKFEIVLETASMNEAELSEYCRRNGLYPEQISAWRETCRSANMQANVRDDREKSRQLSKENKQLKAELRRKEKALAEAAALLVLKKKAQAIWGDPEDEK